MAWKQAAESLKVLGTLMKVSCGGSKYCWVYVFVIVLVQFQRHPAQTELFFKG